MRSRSGVVRVKLGEGDAVDEVLVGIPDDGAWAELSNTLKTASSCGLERATGESFDWVRLALFELVEQVIK